VTWLEWQGSRDYIPGPADRALKQGVPNRGLAEVAPTLRPAPVLSPFCIPALCRPCGVSAGRMHGI
jgi:hypothetical protein